MSMLDEQSYPFSLADEVRLIEAAQAGCRASLNRLMAGYEEPLQQLVSQHGRGGLSEGEAQQVGREGLWQAILAYPTDSPVRFWTLGWGVGAVGCAILTTGQQTTWRRRRAGWRLTDLAAGPPARDPAEIWEGRQIQTALAQMLEILPERLQQVLVAYYGLDGDRPATYRQIGPRLGYSHTRIWQWQHEALARLSHPSHSYRLRSLLGRHTLAEYLTARRRVQRWLRRRGGRRQEGANGA